ncbi:MAG: magnesium chelatase subunit D [Burkholderiaceae bacterium]
MQTDAETVVALLAVDPLGLGGVCLRARAGPAREAWLAQLRGILPQATAMRRVPVNISDTALLGGLDLAATLRAGRPVALQGLLPAADGGVLLLSMAERMPSETAARFCAVLDNGSVSLQRDGLDASCPARVALVALDEGASDDEAMPAALRERLAFWLVLDGQDELGADLAWTAQEVLAARGRLAQVRVDNAVARALCAAGMALGIDSLRAPLLALRAARAAAALVGADLVDEDHLALAARLVLAPRATRLPQLPEPESAPAPASDPPDAAVSHPPDLSQEPAHADASSSPETGSEEDAPDAAQRGEMGERILQATLAALPAGLLASLALGLSPRIRAASGGRAGSVQKSQLRGRPIGARAGEPRAGQRLHVLETLRAAAPWQRLRNSPPATGRIQVRKQDFHVTRFRQRSQTTTIFVVDASGSAALNRLAEAKGAVELLLADCYVRRDRVAVVAFRGAAAEVLLAPTRSLARAKRSLAGLPGGGGTPLASGIDAARAMGEQVRRRGDTPIIVLLTDGRGNVARDGSPGRLAAAHDTLMAARQLRLSGVTTLLLDSSAQPQAAARALATDMGARYLPLPYAGARAMSEAVRALAGLA